MNRQEFEDTARRYREELFRMYASQNPAPPPPPGRKPPLPPPPPRPDSSRPPLPPRPDSSKPPILPRPDSSKPPIPPRSDSSRPPLPPVLPVLAEAETPAEAAALPESPAEPNAPAQPDPAEKPALPKRAYTGFIRVHAVTAEGARPVAGAAVTIVRFTSGEPELIALQTTDSSGETETVSVPSPPPSADQRHPASFLYDISVQADGYYREHSTDVPVFPGVTSVQTFVLIPLPEGGGTISGGDLTYYNDMPQI